MEKKIYRHVKYLLTERKKVCVYYVYTRKRQRCRINSKFKKRWKKRRRTSVSVPSYSYLSVCLCLLPAYYVKGTVMAVHCWLRKSCCMRGFLAEGTLGKLRALINLSTSLSLLLSSSSLEESLWRRAWQAAAAAVWLSLCFLSSQKS